MSWNRLTSALSMLAALVPFATLASSQDCKTTRVSVDTGGGPVGFGAVGNGFVSNDGLRTAFTVQEFNHPTSPFHAYWRDESTGITSQLPGQYPNDISGDGHMVVWESAGIFTTDLTLGTSVRVDVSSAGQPADNQSLWGRTTDDGRYVAFMSRASNLVPNDNNLREDIFVRDLQGGTTERVSVATGGLEANEGSWNAPAISSNGRFVAFNSLASNLVPGDNNAEFDVFLHDRTTGFTTLVSRSMAGSTSPGQSWVRSVSNDGRFVTFDSLVTDLVPGDTNGTWDAFVRDTQFGTTTMYGRNADGTQPHVGSYSGPLSADGRLAVFGSASRRIIAGDRYPGLDVYVRDLVSGSVERVNADSQDDEMSGGFIAVDMSSDGRFITFNTTGAVFMRGCPQAVTRFGEAKQNSGACRPWITWTGTPSATLGSGFTVRVQGERNRQVGRLIYGYQSASSPTLPYLLIGPPLRRLPLERTRGSLTGIDCTGHLEADFNTWISQGSDPGLVPGVTIYAQFWSTDSGFASPYDYNLSDAIDFTIQP